MEGEPTGALELMAPFLSRSEINELCSGRLYEGYRKRKLEVYRRQLEFAIHAQKQTAIESSRRETRFVNGVGQHKMVIDPFLHGLMRRRYGEDCWQDPDFVKDCWKKTPELRVPSPPRRFHPVNGFKDCGAGDGARGDPVTAVDEAARQQTSVASVKSAGSAHEIPAPLPLKTDTNFTN
jgi:hypothetical protein